MKLLVHYNNLMKMYRMWGFHGDDSYCGFLGYDIFHAIWCHNPKATI
jgi:hypothetical protein